MYRRNFGDGFQFKDYSIVDEHIENVSTDWLSLEIDHYLFLPFNQVTPFAELNSHGLLVEAFLKSGAKSVENLIRSLNDPIR